MIWKGLGVLGGTAALIVLGVIGLARLTVPDEPTFSEELEAASETGDGGEGFSPTAPGGRIEITGAREATVSFEGDFDNSTTQIDFESDPLSIGQMYHDGLTFFPEPDACEFTEGEHNEDAGLVVFEISCEALEDIRDNGTITMEGVVALPAGLVMAQDLPATGGTATVGEEAWELSPEAILFVFPDSPGNSDEGPSFSVVSDDIDASLIIVFGYDPESEIVTVASVSYQGEQVEIGSGQCSTESGQLAAINPEHSFHELTFSCDSVQVSSLGEVPIEGTVVFERVLVHDH